MPEWNDRNDADVRLDSESTSTENASPNGEGSAFHDGPEPPTRWNPGASSSVNEIPVAQPEKPQESQGNRIAVIGSTRFEIRSGEIDEFESARRYMTAAQVIAVLSLFFGGVLLSSFALVCAFAANSKLNNLAMAPGRNAEGQRALRRSGIVTIVVAAIALALNILSVIFLQPYLSQVLQSGSLDALSTTPQPNITGNTTWG